MGKIGEKKHLGKGKLARGKRKQSAGTVKE